MLPESENADGGFHPSVHFQCPLQLRVVGGLEPIPADIGRKAGHTLDRLPVHHRAVIVGYTSKIFGSKITDTPHVLNG